MDIAFILGFSWTYLKLGFESLLTRVSLKEDVSGQPSTV